MPKELMVGKAYSTKMLRVPTIVFSRKQEVKSMKQLEWDLLENQQEVVDEVVDGLGSIASRETVMSLIAILLCEYDVSRNELGSVCSKVRELHGNPVSYVDENTGCISIDS